MEFQFKHRLEGRRLLAPIWHTLILVILVVTPTSFLLGHTWIALKEAGRGWVYVADFVFLWVLFALVYLGLYFSKTKVREVTGGFNLGLNEVVWGLSFCAMSFVVALLFVMLERSRLGRSPFQADTTPELLLFMPLAVSAGFVEEVVFRGYLLQQVYAVTGSMQVSLVFQAVVFAVGHGYHITPAEAGNKIAFGILMGLLANWRKSLMPCIVAHTSCDLAAGVLSVLAS